MLAFFRHKTGSKIAIAILSLIVLAFIVTGVFTNEMPGMSSLTGSDSSGTIATVGKQTITASDFESRLRSEYSQAAQQQPGLDMATFVLQAFSPMVEQVIGATALQAYGESIGLAASKKQVDGAIAAIPAFHGVDGSFNQQSYQAVLQQQHVTDAQIRSDIGGDIVRRMLYLPATAAASLPDGVIRAYAGLIVEARTATIGFVPSAAVTPKDSPSDAELQAFYKAHIGAYTTPERRVLRYAVIGRDQVAAGAIPTEDEIKQAYAAAGDKYAAHETRDLSQVVLPDQAKAQAFKASLSGGKSFADAAKAAGFGAADIAVGDKNQAQYAAQSSAAAASAAFALPQGGVSDPVKTDLGWVVVKVNGITKTPAIPYDKARPEIAGDLAKQKQDKALADLVGKVQDAVDNGQGFADVVKAHGLTVTETQPLTAGGIVPDQPDAKPSPDVQPLLAPAFKTSADEPPSVETIQQGERYALLTIGKVIPAAPIPFAQVKSRVAADDTAYKANQKAQALATAIQTKVKAGTSMVDAFKTAGVALPPVQTQTGRRADLARLQGNVPPQIAAVFRAAVGSTTLVPANGNGWYVIHVDKVAPADAATLAAATAQSRADLNQAANNELLEELASSAKQAVGTRRNDAALMTLRARLMGINIVPQQ